MSDGLSKTQQAGVVGMAGAAALATGPFMPWLKASAPLLGTITKSGMEGGDGVFIFLAAILVGVFSLKLFGAGPIPKVATPLTIVGVLVIAAMWYEANDLSNRFADIDTDLISTSYGGGLWLCGAGGVLAVVAAEMVRRVTDCPAVTRQLTVCPLCWKPWQPEDDGSCMECGKTPSGSLR